LRYISAKAEQATINGHDTAKSACFAVKKAKFALFANAFRKMHLFSGHYFTKK